MKACRLVLVFLLVLSFNVNTAQELRLTDKDHIVKSSWIIGLGYNFVDDAGTGTNIGDKFDLDNWNALAYPSRLTIGRYFESGLGLELIGTYNQYKEGKVIDGAVNTAGTYNYGMIDARLSYDLNKIIGETGFFDPYIGAGLGYGKYGGLKQGTYNGVVGFRTWFSDRFGLDFSTTGKWSMRDEGSNHLQHAAGVVYRFGIEKGLSKKGLEKLALINEQQRVQDSINAAKKAEEEARLLAERLAREKEQARLAAEKKAKEEAEQARRLEIEKQIKEAGHVIFPFNSSAITQTEKDRLDKIAVIMKANPTLTLYVTSHADARGSQEYNLKLTEKRVQNTIDYMVNEKGIDAGRFNGEGFGKKKLLNDCDGTKYCPESKHRVNRRSEFEVSGL